MTLKEIVNQLESSGYTCEAGPLENNVAFQALKERSQFKGMTVEVKMTELDVFIRLFLVLVRAVSTTKDENTRNFLSSELETIAEAIGGDDK
ncbi:hypothetical protein [Paenibacillus elgii]|uniref:hypothetical protein n=1 Tax=Paenibacillus elgii TaxID=189691 RepID=UPI00203C6384|nr:hypothetical protein [Paenibacillus elgii]MCM3272646.1 hypothetical protein [Paenibacillus elgii]